MSRQEMVRSNPEAASPSPDRLTRFLVGVALVLVVIVALLAASALAAQKAGEPSRGDGGSISSLSVSTPPGQPVEAAPTVAPVTPPPCVPPLDWVTHVVQEGDTLSTLADRFGADVETLKSVNCLQNDIIVLDRELFVPGPPDVQLITAANDPQAVLPGDFQVTIPSGNLHILLLGSDKREGDGAWRTDTIIVVSIDAERNIVRLLSIPRDLWVNIPGHGYDRINTADLWGEVQQPGSGPEVVKQVVYDNLGIPIHYYVRVDFKGFMEIVDAVGGVEVNVECPLSDIGMEPGVRWMDGEDALLYARSRITTSDFDRSRRQRQLLMALWQQRLNRSLIPKIPALWDAMSGKIQTDLPLDRVVALAYMGLKLNPNQIFSQSIGPWQVESWLTPEGAEVLLPRPDKIQELLDGFYGPVDFAFLEELNQTTIQVQNGSWRAVAGQQAAAALVWLGVQIVDTGPADHQQYAQTQVLVYDASPAVAETVAQELDLMPDAIQYRPDPSSAVDISIVVGADYDPCAIP